MFAQLQEEDIETIQIDNMFEQTQNGSYCMKNEIWMPLKDKHGQSVPVYMSSDVLISAMGVTKADVNGLTEEERDQVDIQIKSALEAISNKGLCKCEGVVATQVKPSQDSQAEKKQSYVRIHVKQFSTRFHPYP